MLRISRLRCLIAIVMVSLCAGCITDKDDDGTHAEAMLEKGESLMASGRYPEALMTLLQAAELADSDSVPDLSMNIHLLTADIYQRDGYTDRAVYHLRQALRFGRLADSPTVPDIWTSLAIAYSENKDFDIATATADSILLRYSHLKEDNPEAWAQTNLRLLEVYVNASDTAKSAKSFTVASAGIERPLESREYVTVGRMYGNAGDCRMAHVYLDSALKTARTPADTMACRLRLGEILRMEGRDQEAVMAEHSYYEWLGTSVSERLREEPIRVEAEFNQWKCARQRHKTGAFLTYGGVAAAVIAIAVIAIVIFWRRRRLLDGKRIDGIEEQLESMHARLKEIDTEILSRSAEKGDVADNNDSRTRKLMMEKVVFANRIADIRSKCGNDGQDDSTLPDVTATFRSEGSRQQFYGFGRLLMESPMRDYESEDGVAKSWEMCKRKQKALPKPEDGMTLKEEDLHLYLLQECGLTVKAVAMVLDVPQKTVYTRLTRLRTKIESLRNPPENTED